MDVFALRNQPDPAGSAGGGSAGGASRQGERPREAAMNPLLEVIRTAHERNWCTKPACTTCGAREYRQALATLSGPLGGGLVSALSDLEPHEVT